VERVAVDIQAVYPKYPEEDVEFCFEEVRAKRRGLLGQHRGRNPPSPMRSTSGNERRQPKQPKVEPTDVENITQGLKETSIVDTSSQSIVGIPEGKSAKPRRMKIREVKEETKTGECDPNVLLVSADTDCSQNET
jgi:hypothetical protein